MTTRRITSRIRNRNKRTAAAAAAAASAVVTPAVASAAPAAAATIVSSPDIPVLIQQGKLRLAYKISRISKRHKDRIIYESAMITIPKDIMQLAGLESGMTMMIEGYRDGRVVLSPSKDIMNTRERDRQGGV